VDPWQGVPFALHTDSLGWLSGYTLTEGLWDVIVEGRVDYRPPLDPVGAPLGMTGAVRVERIILTPRRGKMTVPVR